MQSELPKVLFPAHGRAMVHYVIDALETAGFARILVVVGYRSELVRQELSGRANLEFVEQTEQKGTGHAVQVCRPQLVGHDGLVLIVTGDSPLIQVESIRTLLDEFDRHRPACLLGTLHKPDPTGLGRIVRDADGKFAQVVEEKDATDQQRRITEVNMSTYLFNGPDLLHALDQLRDNNRQKEYYLTDCPGILRNEGRDVRALAALQPCEALSINTVEELRVVELEMRRMGY